MPPRRKKEADETTPAGGPQDGASAPKKRASRAKKKAAPAGPTEVPIQPMKPASPVVPRPQPPAPVIPVAPPLKPPVAPAAKMTIEPDTRFPVDGVAAQEEERWQPPKKEDHDLAMPPRVLLQSKKMPPQEVEDILEEPEEPHHEAHPSFHPPIRTGLYRKLGVGFAVVALVVLGLVGYVTYSHATVIIHPSKIQVKTERSIVVSQQPAADDEVPGEITEVTVAGEKSVAPGAAMMDASATPEAAPAAPAAPVVDASAVYTGIATLHNQTGTPVTLIPKTRLLSSGGVLFRMKDRATVPAGGTAKVSVYADQPGPTGAIGPSRFTIPGLSAAQQKVVFATSDAAMTVPGTAATVPTSTAAPSSSAAQPATLDEINAVETALRQQLTDQAKDELAKKIQGTWSGQAFLVETMSRFINVAAGESTDAIVVRITLRVRSVSYDRAKAVAVAVADLKRGLTADRELEAVSGDNAAIDVERADPKTGEASLHIVLTGQSTVSLQSPLFDPEKLKGLDLKAVQAYFNGVEGIDQVDVRFRPFFIKRMPNLANHIDFQIAQ